MLTEQNNVFEYDLYGTFICVSITTAAAIGNFGIKVGNDTEFLNVLNVLPNNFLGYIRIDFPTSLSTFKYHFRYVLTFSNIGSNNFYYSASFTMDQDETTLYTKCLNRFFTNSQTLDINLYVIDSIYTILSPSFIPSQLNTGQSITFTKYGHTFRQIA